MSDVLEIQDHSEVEDNESATDRLTFTAKRRRGRGFGDRCDSELDKIGHFDSLRYEPERRQDWPQKSVEGWVLFVEGLHEEANEDDVRTVFCEHGNVSNLALNMDRRTGFLKGYALVEYKSYEEAFKARENLDESILLDRQISVNWAFVQKPNVKQRRHTYK